MYDHDTWAVPGEYDIEVCLELDDGSTTDWQPGRCRVDNESRIRLLTTHDWTPGKQSVISHWRLRGVPLAARFPSGSRMLSKIDTITLKPS